MIIAHERVPVRFLSAHDLHREKGKIETTYKNSYYAISVRLYGEAEFSIDGKKITAGRGGVLIIPPNLHYSQFTEGERILAIHMEISEYRETENIEYVPVKDWGTVCDIFREIWQLNTDKPEGWYYRIMSTLYRLLEILHKSAEQHEDTAEDSIDASALFLDEHYAEHSLTVKLLAEMSGYSEAYFRRVYQMRYGTAPSDRIAYLRLECAKRLLESGEHTMTEIADKIGIGEPKYFSTWFRKHTGMSPRNYVNTLRG